LSPEGSPARLKSDAQTFLDGVRGDPARGVDIGPAGARVLFCDYAESWRWAWRTVSIATLSGDDGLALVVG
jgi:hypothetical protein